MNITMKRRKTRWAEVLLVLVGAANALPSWTSSGLQTKINSLPETGGVVWVEPGVTQVTEPIRLRDGVQFKGRGPGAVLRVAPGIKAAIFLPDSFKNGVARVLLEDLTLDGDGAQQTWSTNDWSSRFRAAEEKSIDNIGLYLKNSRAVTVRRVQFFNFLNEGMMAVSCSSLRVESCVFSNNCPTGSPQNDFAQGALYLRQVTESAFISNRLQWCGEGGLVLGLGCRGNWVEGNRSEDSPSGEGIFIGASCSNTIVGNTVRRAGYGGRGFGAGISVSLPMNLGKDQFPSKGNAILRNTVEDTGGPGILVLRCDDTLVEGNSIFRGNGQKNARQGGFKAYQVSGLVLVSNVIRHTVSGEPVVLEQAEGAVVVGNTGEGL